MIPYLSTLLEFISKYSLQISLIILLFLIIVYLIKVILDEDLSSSWRARFYGAVYKIFRTSEAEKKYIENDIASRINLARRNMPFAEEYLPKGIKVKWFEGGSGETSQFEDNQLMVRLDPAESQEKNVVLMAGALVKKTSLAGIRHIITEPIELSMDLNLVKDLLKEIGDRRIMDWFFLNEYQPVINKTGERKDWNSKIVEIDDRGLFTRLLLVELDNFSKQIIGKLPTPEMLSEITGLINYLYKLATKAYGHDIPLEYITRHIKIGIILVGYTSTIIYEGITKYLTAFAIKLKQQLDSIYLIQWDKELLGVRNPEAYEQFVAETKSLDKKIEQRFQIKKDFELNYVCTDSAGQRRKAKIFHYIPEYLA